MKGWDLKHIQSLKDQGRIVDYKICTKKPENNSHNLPKNIPKRNKYGNKKTVVNGIEFDSSKEANRYKELLLLLKAGLIGLLELQQPFELNEGGTHSLKYYADFVYIDALTGQKVVEDVKSAGTITQVYKKKRRLMWQIHKIKIKEV